MIPTLEASRRELVLRALVELDYDVTRAAAALGVTRDALYKMLRRWSLPTPVGGPAGATLYSEHRRRCERLRDAWLETTRDLK